MPIADFLTIILAIVFIVIEFAGMNKKQRNQFELSEKKRWENGKTKTGRIAIAPMIMVVVLFALDWLVLR